ncbi:MAG: thioredoxin domain-containing protein [Gemmatimonadota bacterium]
MNGHLETAGTVTVILAALAVTSSVVHREFFNPGAAVGASGAVQGAVLSERPTEPVYIEDWRGLLERGTQIGADPAAVEMVVFTDFQCPYCQRFHAAYRNAKALLGNDFRLTYLHYPLTTHPHAEQAAQAAECAGAQGQFSAFADALFEQQASIGIKSWMSYADGVGIPDTATFNRCAASDSHSEKITKGKEEGVALGVTGTPTVIINGWRLPRPPHDSLAEVIEAILDGRPPYSSAG